MVFLLRKLDTITMKKWPAYGAGLLHKKWCRMKIKRRRVLKWQKSVENDGNKQNKNKRPYSAHTSNITALFGSICALAFFVLININTLFCRYKKNSSILDGTGWTSPWWNLNKNKWIIRMNPMNSSISIRE